MISRPLLTFVRPGPNALTWLGGVIADLKGSDPLRPVTVLVPNDYSGQQVRWHLGRAGGYANVFTLRLSALARSLASERVVERDLWPVIERGAVRAALARHSDAFGGLAHASLQAALLELFREARRAEVDLGKVVAEAEEGRCSPAARDAARVYRTYAARIAGYDNNTTEVRRAAEELAGAAVPPPALIQRGALILFLPTRLDPGEVRFLAAAARFVPLVVGLIDTGDRREDGEKPSWEMAEQLSNALGVEAPIAEEAGKPVAELRVIRAPDPAEEVREVVRRVVADRAAGVPLYNMAILYRQNDPYADLVRDALGWAGFPWASSEGRRLADTRPGRSLLLLLGLGDRQFSREAVLEWLDTGPRPDFPEEIPPDAVWARLTRAANVTRGEAQWASRLAAHAERLAASLPRGEIDAEAAGGEDGPNPETRYTATRRALAQTRTIQRFVAALAAALRPPPIGASWSDYVAWARLLRDRYVGGPERWPAGSEREAAGAVATALEGLAAADELGGDGPAPAAFREALGVTLEEERLPTGELGRGILIEPVAAVVGLSFERVYILGMTEGAFPPPPGADPFFPEEDTDPLRRRARQRAKERRDFLAALATVEGNGGVLTLSAPDAAEARASFPSRWLLEAIQTYRGVPILGTHFSTFHAAGQDWLTSVNSSHHAVLRAVAPADEEDYRLQQVARWTRAGRLLRDHPLARSEDSPLGRALRLIRERQSFRFTEFDGNLAALAGTSRLGEIFRRARPLSASALQTWAVCGYRYFLSYVLRIEPTEDPEQRGTIDALERGSLVHQILEQFFQRLARDGRPRADEGYTERDYRLMEELARAAFAEAGERGVTGHPLDWEMTRRGILADLREFLVKDARWRADTGFVPRHLEQAFGGSAEWRALELLVGAERLAFRGRVDRIDRRADEGVFVVDYKTGAGRGYDTLADDPVAAGQHLQLALYNRAVRENLPGAGAVSSAFWFVTRAGKFRQVAVESSPAVDERLSAVLAIITRGIRGGAFPMVPGPEGQRGPENCAYCDYDRICPVRRDLLAGHKAADPGAGIHRRLALPGGGGTGDHG